MKPFSWPILLALFIVAMALSSCKIVRPKVTFGKEGCTLCHREVRLFDHDFRCDVCHLGDPKAITKDRAHRSLVVAPGGSPQARMVCFPCHRNEVEHAEASTHYTLKDEIKRVWNAFFPGEAPPSLQEIPVEVPVETLQGLVGDLLRRRCLRCHVYSSGDGYPGTLRRLGCGACHMRPWKDRPGVHRFYKRPSDRNCLACHNRNFVGWDYYGRYEKDITAQFQVPWRGGKREKALYGTQWFPLSPDIHREKGLLCVDCHRRGACGRGKKDLGCRDCHMDIDPKVPGHRRGDEAKASCAVCHALWSFNDRGRTLVRQDIANYWAWYDLRFQGIGQIETLLEDAYLIDPDLWPAPVMRDEFSGELRQGIWYETFLERRWWPVKIGRDEHGVLRVLRPLLDLELIYVDSEGDVRVDGLRPRTRLKGGYTAYSPHTIGQPDIFRTIRVER